MSIGLSENSNEKERTVKDGDVVTNYTVKELSIDLKPLKEELTDLENMEEPSDEEVLTAAKQGKTHPYYSIDRIDRMENLRKRIERLENGS